MKGGGANLVRTGSWVGGIECSIPQSLESSPEQDIEPVATESLAKEPDQIPGTEPDGGDQGNTGSEPSRLYPPEADSTAPGPIEPEPGP